MPNRNNTNRAERAAAKAHAETHGVPYQKALKIVRARRGHQQLGQRAAQQVATVNSRLDASARAELLRQVEAVVAARGAWPMNEFTPRDIIEGDIEESTLLNLDLHEVLVVEDAELVSGAGDPERWSVHSQVLGVGEVEWQVNAPSGFDIEFYGDSLGGDSGGPGVVHEIEPEVPVQLQVWGEWAPATGTWTDVEIQYVSMPQDAIAERADRHSDQEFTRMQQTGQMPSDEEIEFMDSELWRSMGAQTRHDVSQLRQVDVPTDAGVYAWYRDGKPIYVGKATSLQQRVWGNHLGAGRSLKSSAFRRNVAEHLHIATANDIKTGAYELTDDDVSAVRAFIEGCAVAWIACATVDEAEDLERRIKQEWMPPLTRR